MSTQADTQLFAGHAGAKFRELLLYIASRNEDDQDFGKIRLCKALFYADWNAYIATGKTITGRVYVRGPHGPMPDRISEILQELEDSRTIATQRVSRGGYPQRRTVALRDADLSVFTASEIAIVDQVIEDQRGVSAAGISDRSHREITAWALARDGEPIPFEASWVSRRPLVAEEIAYGLFLASRT